MQIHNIEPVYDKNSKVLILGSFPSVKSRESGFFYGHPQNRFWRVLASIFNKEEPKSIKDKKSLILSSNLAVWDVIKSCEIEGSSDSSIKNVRINDISKIINLSRIENIYANGQLAGKLYKKYIYDKTGYPIKVLPSTSPANAAYSFEKLCLSWQLITKDL